MSLIAVLLGLSFGISGFGGLLSGIVAPSLRWAVVCGLGFGLVDTVRINLQSGSMIPVFLIIGGFWAMAGWFAIGRWLHRKRNR